MSKRTCCTDTALFFLFFFLQILFLHKKKKQSAGKLCMLDNLLTDENYLLRNNSTTRVLNAPAAFLRQYMTFLHDITFPNMFHPWRREKKEKKHVTMGAKKEKQLYAAFVFASFFVFLRFIKLESRSLCSAVHCSSNMLTLEISPYLFKGTEMTQKMAIVVRLHVNATVGCPCNIGMYSQQPYIHP